MACELEEPVRAYKAATLDANGGLMGANGNYYHLPISYAQCMRRMPTYQYGNSYSMRWEMTGQHPAEELEPCRSDHSIMVPNASCSCGFYGFKEQHKFDGYQQFNREGIWLEVEFAGNIIDAELGFRAQWQRILVVELSGPYYDAFAHRLRETGYEVRRKE